MKYHPPFGSVDPDAHYVDKNVPGAIRGSAVPAAAIEIPQREIVDFILKSGLVPSDETLQLAQGVQTGKVNFAAAAGPANALTATMSPAPAELTLGMRLTLLISTANTGAATLNVNGFGAIPITLIDGGALGAGDLPAGVPISLVYTGSAWALVGVSLSQLQKASIGQTQIFSSSGTFTVPAGVYLINVSLIAAGGGGARGGGAYNLSGGGGGAGGYAEKLITTTPGTNYAVTIGAGGARGDTLGGTGGTTSFGSVFSATGGFGGNAVSGNCAGGSGGTGIGGDFNILGANGLDGNTQSATVQGGAGAGSIYGGGGPSVDGGGGDGKVPGAGGGGAWGITQAFGAKGAAGLAVVRW
ncbi:hypothetical protein [Agrobacterium pusense]|uniref:glycine-rich domain-containing protein n=1 Tax=Agrobacterium pusense TaxID=648995 RepID=UPI000D1B1329|nr:hypothetical protein [Agrobacterium pusense]